MIDEQRLREGLQRLLRDTEAAIRERISDEPSIEAQLQERHAAAVRAGRTAGSAAGCNSFADEAVTQSAVHWLLGCVFVRFLEDNGWLDERGTVGKPNKVAWIAGTARRPEDLPDFVARLDVAKANRTLFLRPDPSLTDRDYLLHVFGEVARLPGMAGLFDPHHNPLFQLGPTAQGAAKIVEFFQKVDTDTGTLAHDFSDVEHRTRFLGDLYQNLSESARKRYALCQTPDFVIDFILDRTLTPAIDAFGLEQVRLIDPACGSGHFLLAAFSRIFRMWQGREPTTNPPDLARRALAAVHGVDLNPFAAEISRFRLLIAALEASGEARLRDAFAFSIQVAAGDSLLHGSRPRDVGGVQTGLYEDRHQFFYETEDAEEVKRILSQPYHVVVGNPPYINVSDPVLREAYRERFSTCHGKYQLGVPFTERFFDLTVYSEEPKNQPAGWMGMIVSNAFMKRTFGKKLIESFLRHRDLTYVIDTSGVYLPGHGTPTTILIGRHQRPMAETVRAVRGIRGESGVPEDPSTAPVWREIADHVADPGFEGNLVSVADAPRSTFERFPWSLGGGGATELKEQIEESTDLRLGGSCRDLGIFGISAADDVLLADKAAFRRRHLPPFLHKPLFTGDQIKGWCVFSFPEIIFPYSQGEILDLKAQPELHMWMWQARTSLGNRATFSNGTYFSEGRPWWGWHQLSMHRLVPPSSIVLSDVDTHNNFVLDRGGSVFDRHSPVIKLDPGVSDGAYCGLLGSLNSSTACFWLKQVCFPKGGDPVGDDGARIRKVLWDVYYEFDITKLKQLPIPTDKPTQISELIQAEADARSAQLPDKICAIGIPTRAALDAARDRGAVNLGRMIALQEELDWQCYRLYGIIDEDLTAPLDEVPPLILGQRAFEIRMARQMQQGTLETTWFERHDAHPITDLPPHWPEAYSRICARRLEVMQQNRDIGLIEQPEYKRRWNLPPWEEMEQFALKYWLLERMEANAIWRDLGVVSCGQLRDALARDADWVSVAEAYVGGPVEDLDELVTRLAVAEAVPALPVLRYTEAGLRKRGEWEHVWELQRKQDAGESIVISPPPKFRRNDFLKADYWRLRGGLDVPKERFILYPGLERDGDQTPVLGWAGCNHLDQARALADYYQRIRAEEGWEPERLRPILSGVLDLKPWLLQWYNDLDPETGVRLGEYFVQFAESQCQGLGFSPEEVRAWQPTAAARPSRRGRRSGQSDARRSQ